MRNFYTNRSQVSSSRRRNSFWTSMLFMGLPLKIKSMRIFPSTFWWSWFCKRLHSCLFSLLNCICWNSKRKLKSFIWFERNYMKERFHSIITIGNRLRNSGDLLYGNKKLISRNLRQSKIAFIWNKYDSLRSKNWRFIWCYPFSF